MPGVFAYTRVAKQAARAPFFGRYWWWSVVNAEGAGI